MISKATSIFLVITTAVLFISALILLSLLLANASLWVSLNMQNQLFFLVLVMLGLIPALILFSFFKSYAKYKGKAFGGTLELGGPVVVFLLVLILGFILPNDQSSFNVSIFVNRSDNGAPLPTGKALFIFGNQGPRTIQINQGDGYIRGIPNEFLDQDVQVRLLEPQGYEFLQDIVKLENSGINISVKPKSMPLIGYVKTLEGTPIPEARVSVKSFVTTTDQNGYFEFRVPGSKPEDRMSLQVNAVGFNTSVYTVMPSSDEIQAILIEDGTQ